MMLAALMVGDLEQDCTLCVRSKVHRRQWGCDSPSSVPYAFSECPSCSGTDVDCQRCRGDKKGVPWNRCPYQVLPPEVLRLSALYGDWAEGRMPFAPTVYEHPSSFVDAMRLIGNQIAKRQRAEQDRMRAEAEKSAQKAKSRSQGGRVGRR